MSKAPFLTSACFALGLAAGDRGRTLSLEGWVGIDGLHGSREMKKVPKIHKPLIFYNFLMLHTASSDKFLSFFQILGWTSGTQQKNLDVQNGTSFLITTFIREKAFRRVLTFYKAVINGFKTFFSKC